MATVQKSERTKTRVLREALALASRVGFAGLTFGTLAEQAGISKSGLFAHFESKEDLQIQTLRVAEQMFVERVLGPAVKEPRGVARLRRLFDGWMEWIHSGTVPRGDILTAAAFEFDDAPDGPMRAAVVEGHGKMHGTIERMARQAVEAGQFAAGIEPAQFAFEFLGIVHAHHHVRRLLRTDLHARRARAAFERLLATSAA
ncbi:MAG: TetR/AcrR family transcriptional regulator [Betaproteobacteria bacterium]